MENLINDDLLIRYLTETATSEEIIQVEQWYVSSNENQKTLEQLYFTMQINNRLKVIRSVNHDYALGDLKNRIWKQEKRLKRRIFFRRLQQVAASLFLPVLLFSIWGLLHKDKVDIQYVELHSNPGMVTYFKLPDESKVWLNGGSCLRYPNIFKGKKREVEMSGQGYFEITPNPQQAFSVKTGESFSLEVLGTSFNLSAYDDENIIETTLVEGSVRIQMMQDGKMMQHMMKPNEKVIYTKNKETLKVATGHPQNSFITSPKDTKPESVKIATVDPKYDIAWKDNRILFRNHPMEEVIRTLGRYYNVHFVVKNNKVMDSRITGGFSNEQLPQVMEYLRIASGIKYKIIPASVESGEMTTEVVEIWK
jgi:ferric-dicitrate binding protein FerR (iron transport regulator)